MRHYHWPSMDQLHNDMGARNDSSWVICLLRVICVGTWYFYPRRRTTATRYYTNIICHERDIAMIKIQFNKLIDLDDSSLLEQIVKKLNLQGMRSKVTLAKGEFWADNQRELRVDVMPRSGQERYMSKKLRQLEHNGTSLVNGVAIIAEMD